jgi:putative flippase GtrA
MTKLLDRYPAYFMVGTFAAAVTIGLREIVGRILGDDQPIGYGISMVVGYSIGIMISYTLQRRFTFTQARNNTSEQLKFIGTALFGMALTIALAYGLQLGLQFVPFFPQFHKTLAFTGGALLTSFVTYFINKKFTFKLS